MNRQAVMRPPVRVFYSYAHEDEELRNELEKHLRLLQRRGIIQPWHDREITAGRDWEGAIDENLEKAELILLLISSDLLDSDYCYDNEMKRALARHEADEAWVVPVHLRPVDWKDAPFAHLQALPTDARPVTEWANRDQAFKNIAEGIRQAVQAIRQTAADVPITHTLLTAPHPLDADLERQAADLPITHTPLTVLEGSHRPRRRRVLLLLSAIALLSAAGLGWYGYTHHIAPIAWTLAAGDRFLATGL